MSSNYYITLRRTGGFYQVFDNDALIVSYLFNYKINNYKVGFPVSAYNKVINTLEDKYINYVVKEKEEIITKDFKNRNKYSKFLEKSIIKDNVNNRINKILDKINNMDKDELELILNRIEEIIYE